MSAHKPYERYATEILRFVTRYSETHGYPPSVREIASATHRSVADTHGRLQRMIEGGLITVTPGLARAIRITETAMVALSETL